MKEYKSVEELYENHFQRKMEEIKTGEGDIQALTCSSLIELMGIYCRKEEKFGLFTSNTRENDYEEITEKIKEHIPFYEDLDKDVKRVFRESLIVSGYSLLLFDSFNKLNAYYDSVGDHNINRNPFYLATIHKRGNVLRENT